MSRNLHAHEYKLSVVPHSEIFTHTHNANEHSSLDKPFRKVFDLFICRGFFDELAMIVYNHCSIYTLLSDLRGNL